jgi:glycosyltransferase involved in cell wall biosynthesis
VYWNNIPSPYFVERLNAVADRGNVDIEAWFLERLEPDRSWIVDESRFRFRYRYLPGVAVDLRRLGRVHISVPAPLARRPRPDLVVSLYAEPTFLLGWQMARMAAIRTAFRFLPTYDSWVHRTWLKEAVKRWVFPRVDAVKVPGPDGAALASRYGVPSERIFVVRQSVNVGHWERGRAKWLAHREQIRQELGLHGCVFTYVGRLWRGKGLDDLLAAYETLARLDREVSLLLVGDGVDEKRYRRVVVERALRNVVFTGFAQQDELPRLYAASDVLVFPTLGDPNGLVVEEAMASHLPVISSDAAGDVRSRLADGTAGFVVPAADRAALTARMAELAADPGRRASMGEAAAQLAATRNHSGYAEDFERFVEGVLSMPRVGR